MSGGTNRIVRLVAETYDTELDYLVSGAAGYVTIAAGTLATQLGGVLTNFNGGASRTISLSVQGVAPFTTTVMPAISYSGQTLRQVIERVLANAGATIGGTTRARYHMGLDTTTGAVAFGEPRLYAYDAGNPPPPGAATWSFSDTPGGAVKVIWDPYEQEQEGGGLVNRLQSVLGIDGTVTTGSDATSIGQYPNPFSPSSAWQGKPFTDHKSVDGTEAAAEIARRLVESAYPLKLFRFRTNERVLPFDWCAITWAPDGVAAAYYQAIAMDVDFSQANEPWAELVLARDGNVESAVPHPGPPGPPTDLTATTKGATGDGSMGLYKLGWTAPGDGSVPAYYEIQRRIDVDRDGLSYTPWSPVEKVLGDQAAAWLGPVPVDKQHEFRARAVDTWGQVGAWSTVLVDSVAAPVYASLPNPGFEMARPVKSGHPEFWSLGSGVVAARVALDSTDGYDGRVSCKLLATLLAKSEIVSQHVRVNEAREYLVRLFAKSDNAVPANFNLKVGWYDKAGVLISEADEIAATAVPTAWTEYTAKLTAIPAGSVSVVLSPRVDLGTSYNVWVDGFTFGPLVEALDIR